MSELFPFGSHQHFPWVVSKQLDSSGLSAGSRAELGPREVEIQAAVGRSRRVPASTDTHRVGGVSLRWCWARILELKKT